MIIFKQNLFFLNTFIWVYFTVFISHAQSTSIDIEKVNVGKGRMDQIVYDIIQDQQGFIWLGMPSGLVRYDGYEFHHFLMQPDDRSFLRANRVNQLLELPSGKILYLIGNETNSWIRIFNPLFNQHQTIKRLEGKPFLTYSNPHLNKIMLADNSGRVWLRSDHGLYEINEKKDSFHLAHHGNPAMALSSDTIHALLLDEQQRLWIGTDRGLNVYDTKNKRIDHFPPILESSVISLCQMHSGKILAGTRSSGLFIIEPTTGEVKKLVSEPETEFGKRQPAITKVVTVPSGAIFLLIHDQKKRQIFLKKISSEDNLAQVFDPPWIPREQLRDRYYGNLNFFPAKSGAIYLSYGQSFGVYHSRQDRLLFSSANNSGPIGWISLGCFLEDNNGVIWLGGEGGLFKHAPSRHKFALFNYQASEPLNFYEDKSRPLFEDNLGFIWEGTKNGLYKLRLDKEKATVKEYFPGLILSILQDQQQQIWVGTKDGLKKYRPELGDLQTIPFFSKKGTPAQFFMITHLASRKDGLIWAGTFGQGLLLFDPVQESFLSHKSYSNDPKVRVIYTLYPDREGELWIGNRNDITRFLPKEQAFESIKKSSWVFQFHEDAQGRLWAASPEYGLQRIEKEENEIFDQTTSGELPSTECYGLLEDDHGGLWLSTDVGLVHYRPEAGDYRLYNESDGIPPAGLSLSNPFKRKNGEMMFPLASERGFLLFHPDSLSVDSTLPQVVFTDFKLLSGKKKEEYQKAINYIDKIVLHHDQNDFRVSFSALHYASPADNRYAYRFEGWQDEWIDLGHSRSVHFSNLHPGTYKLQVKASNYDDVWTPTPKMLIIQVLPPWWGTSLAFVLYTVLFLLLVYGIYRYQIRRRLAEAESERLKEMDLAKTRLYNNITHEFRTPLTIILGITAQLKQWLEGKYVSELSMISRNGKVLLRLVNQMLELGKAESGTLKTHFIQGDIIVFLRYLTLSFHTQAQAKDIDLQFISEIDHLIMDYEPEKTQGIISNLISNALKFTPVGGKVSVKAEKVAPFQKKPSGEGGKNTSHSKWASTDRLIIQVTDSGVGIKEEELPFVFDRFFRGEHIQKQNIEGAGIGLSLVRELVNLLRGEITVESKFGEGTCFSIWLPIRHTAPLDESPAFVSEAATGKASLSPLKIEATRDRAKNNSKPLLLVVEDHDDLVQYLSSLLSGHYRMKIAKNGRAGWEKALEHTPDIIISDIMMPEMDGLELLSHLKENKRTDHIPVVLLTAKADIASRLQGLKLGADAYLAKPFHKEELFVTLRKLVELRKKLQKRYQQQAPLTPTTDQTFQTQDLFIQELHQVLDAILSNEHLDIEELSRRLAMSRSQLYRKIKALTGQPVNKYIQLFRLHKAKQLLLASRLKVTEVAFEVGFKDVSHFSKVFRSQFGRSPSEVRQ